MINKINFTAKRDVSFEILTNLSHRDKPAKADKFVSYFVYSFLVICISVILPVLSVGWRQSMFVYILDVLAI